MSGRWMHRYLSPAVTCAGATLLAAALLATLVVLVNKAGGLAPLASLPRLRTIGIAWLGFAVLDGALLAMAFRLAAGDRQRGFWQPLVVSTGALALTTVIAEGVLRAVARPAPQGVTVGSLNLLPHDWRQVQRISAQWLERTRQPTSVLDVEDQDFGWDLGRGRQSADGMYATGTGGFRVRDPASPPDLSRASYRIALIGDSFTFGEEVDFDDTWGQQLEQQLPEGAVVLNFGVPSHGPDQTLLKYGRDVRPVKADVTIFGFLSGSPLRNVSIYQLLRPELALPYSKPRFELLNGALVSLNKPPLAAEQILEMPAVWSLDLLRHDGYFYVGEWAAPLGTRSYVVRYLASRFPRHRRAGEQIGDETVIRLGAEIIGAMVDEIRSAGSVPIVVALPVAADLTGGPVTLRDGIIDSLAQRQIPVLELGSCMLRQLRIGDVFVASNRRRPAQGDPGPAHYSAAGNAAVANCLAPQVRAILLAGAM